MSWKLGSGRDEFDAFQLLTDAMLTARPEEPIPAFGPVPPVPDTRPVSQHRAASNEERWQLDIVMMTPAGEGAGES